MPELYGLDIETDTSISPTSGLDPQVGGITSIALATGHHDQVFLGDERTMLIDLDAALKNLPAGIIITWNGAVFDLPFISSRASILGVPLGLVTHHNPDAYVKYAPTPGWPGGVRASWGQHAHQDVQYAYRAHAETLGIKWSLKPVARSIGLDPVEVDRENMHLLTQEEERVYVLSDAVVTRELALRLEQH